LEIVRALSSYTEISPSGNGLHIFVAAEGANITRHRKQGGFVEIYSDARYFTVTGNFYGEANSIENRSAELQQVHDKYLLTKPQKKPIRVAYTEMVLGDVDSFQRGLVKDPVLRTCWNGERRNGDESASDIAFMNKLAYWCNACVPAMLAAFFESPYYKQKDEAHKQKCLRNDYLPNTAKAACATLNSTAEQDTARFKQMKTRGEAR
jgi:putative DNA primase/helicase